MIVYIDKEHKAHAEPAPDRTPFETPFFDGKSEHFISCYSVVIDGDTASIFPLKDTIIIAGEEDANKNEALARLGVVTDTVLENGVQAVRNTLDKVATKVEDVDAYDVYELFPLWQEEKEYTVGERVRYVNEDCIFKCIQAHKSQADWTPAETPALWGRLDEKHKGTKKDPIPAALGMVYFKDKYYIENEVLYLCTRDSVNELYHMPSALVGHYFEKV